MDGPCERQYAHIGEVCDASDEVALRDPELAIRFLEGFRERDDFHPWGDFFILRHAERAYENAHCGEVRQSRLTVLRRLALEFLAVAPEHQAAWPIVVHAFRRTGQYRPVVLRLAEQIRRAPVLQAPWLAMSVAECLFNVSAAEGRRIAGKALEGGILAPDTVAGALRLGVFLGELRDALAGLSAPSAWGLEFGSGPLLRRDETGCVHVNISWLGLTQIDDWLLPLSEPFFNALFALFEWMDPVFDDIFLDNWDSVSGADTCHGLFVQLIQPFLPSRPPTPPKPVRLAPAVVHPGELWVRAGNGQLWALRSYLDHPEATCRAARTVAEALQAGEAAKLLAWVENDPWWPRCDPVANVARLVLNAGWYAAPETAGSAFQDWAERYRRALERAHLLSGHAHMYLPLVPLLPALKTKRLSVFVLERFLAGFAGARLVFATAFAPQVEAQFASGNVHALWSAAGIEARLQSLTCVASPISAWPRRPHADWSASFESLVDACEAAIRANQANVFMAACGGYGLPIVDEIHRRTGIASLYPGHMANMLFGLYTDAFRTLPFYANHSELPYWIDGRLTEAYPEIASIDHGRYAASPRSTARHLPRGGA